MNASPRTPEDGGSPTATWKPPPTVRWNGLAARATLLLALALGALSGVSLLVRHNRAAVSGRSLKRQQALETGHRAAALDRMLTARESEVEALAADPTLEELQRPQQPRLPGGHLPGAQHLELARRLSSATELICVTDSAGRVGIRVTAPGISAACPPSETGTEVQSSPGPSLQLRIARALPGGAGGMVVVQMRLAREVSPLATLWLGADEAEQFTVSDREPRGVDAACARVGSRMLWVQSELDLSSAVKLYETSFGTFSGTMVLLMMLAGGGLLLFLRGLTVPLSRVVATSGRMAAGELTARARVEGPREVRELGSAINHLAASVQRGLSQVTGLRDAFELETATRGLETLQALEATWAVHRQVEESALKMREETEALAEKNRGLERSSRLKSEFLGTMSHELRTPLNAVLGFSELLLEGLDGELNPAQRDAVSDIRLAGKHLLVVINDLLDHGKAESGQMTFEQDTLDLREPVSQAAEMVRALSTRKGVVLEVELSTPVLALGDVKRLRQVALNLFSNAVKFTPPGGTVTVRMRPSREGDWAELEVEDTGVGIDESHHELIFEAFGQVQGGPMPEQEGTGLGLALVKRFLQGMHGDVRVESTLGKGARFIARVPAPHAAVSTQPALPVLAVGGRA